MMYAIGTLDIFVLIELDYPGVPISKFDLYN